MANAKQGFIEKMYIKTVVDSQPLLIVPTEQKETQNSKKDSYLRLPISVALLEELAALKNLHLEYKEAQLVSDRVKEIVDNYLKKLDTDSISIPQELLSTIDESSSWNSTTQKKTINWKAVILKLHEAIVETPKSFEVLTNFVKPLSASTEKTMDKITSTSEEETIEDEEEEEDDSDPNVYSSSPGRTSSIPSSAFAHGSMAWVGPTPNMPAPSGPGLLQKTPQLMKSSPFIPIKGHKKKKNPIVETVIATSPTNKLTLRASSDKITSPMISVPKQEEPIIGTMPMARSFDSKTGSVGQLAAALNSSLTFPSPNAPEIPLTTSGAPVRTTSTFGFEPSQSTFSTTIPLQTSPGQPQPTTTIPITTGIPPTAPIVETVGSFPRTGPTEITQNLPPMRLTESALRHVGIGQSLIYAKAPLVDPIRVDQPRSDTISITSPSLPEIAAYQPSEELTVFLEAPHTSELIVYPAAYFRRKEEKELIERTVLSDIMITHESVSLPRWLDILVYWGPKPQDEGILFSLESILVACTTTHHFDVWLQSALSFALYSCLTEILKEKISPHYRALASNYLTNYSSVVTESKSEERLKETWKQMNETAWTKQYFEKVVTDVITARYDFQVEKVLNSLESNMLLFLKSGHPSLKHIEQILVSLLGHDVPVARERAVKLLNTFYDGHDWQLTEAFQPVIRYIDDSFITEIDIENYTIDKHNVYMIVYSPNALKPNTYVLSRYVPLMQDEKKLVINLGTFKCAGYYDWRFVSLDQDGNYVPLLSKTGGKKLSKVQGRVIVQPAIRDEIIHEVWAEAHDSDWDRRNDNLVKKGNFVSVAKAIPEYQNKYKVSTLYVMGALERNKHANPFAPTDRSAPNRWLGGSSDFDNLVSTAKSLGVKIMVDATARLSARGCHRKYRELLCSVLDGETDSLKPHPGSDGRDFTWNDCVLLNFRKRATWELMVNEMREWASRGVSGIRLDAAHSWPLVLRPNSIELLREDNDGQYHYNLEEILEGHVVLPATDEANSYGYYGTEASHEYPNPLFIKMTRQIWKEFPNFFFLGEIYWNRESSAITSGLIPYASGLPRALASVFDLGIHKDGSITYLPERKSVRVFYDWYQRERLGYPQNALTVYPSSSHYLPYPTSIYGAGSWAAVDLLFFLPEVPLTYGNEHRGYTVSVDVTKNKYVAAEFDKTIRNLDFSPIQGHYEHRAMMRKNYPVLKEGGMIPLFAYWGNGWHDRVFAFARFTKKQMAIIAINFNDVESIFYVDHSPLKEICEINSNVIYRVVDFINPTNPPQYYSADEFLSEKKYIRLGPFASMCWGVYVQAESPTAQRVLYEHSLGRLQRLISNGLDPTNNMIYTIITEGLNKGLTPFSECLKRISEQTGMSNAMALPGTLQYILYSVVKPLPDLHTKALAFLTHLSQKGDGFLQRLCQQILQYNIMGPIVFVTPEMGRFSTVGGVGVMVDELTRALAALGLDIHVISPYYNFNRKGKTGYLEAEGVHWLQNIVTYIGFEYCEVGIHQGKEHGVQLHFLHNFNYFPTPYSTGSPSYQLKQIVLMAKASLELCCQLRILPSMVITNDWFTALVPAYAKRSGSFGTTFSGTTFFHLIHNLEEGYEGKIYIDGQDDMGSIHQLSRELFVESFPGGVVLNASRAALQTCDQWGTVSTSYRDDLIRTSPLGALLMRYPQPFGKQNGIRLEERLELLKTVAKDHEEAKAKLQKKYFGESDPNIPILAFIGRIVLQKGVHLILNAVREIVDMTKGKVQILVGGMANMKDPYAAQCAWSMEGLRKQFPKQFWADPYEFFTDGPLVNYGTDFALMPSLFEPSGVVQQEFFAGGTPVIAFKTGGLKDSVFEFDTAKGTGNGFTFEAHAHGDFVYAVSRALNVFWNREHYAKLRKSARDAVLDVEEVAIAWTREYTRLRQRIWSPPGALALCMKEIEKTAKNEEVPQEEKKESTL